MSDEDLQGWLQADPAVDAAKKLAPVFRELCKTFERGESVTFIQDYWNWLLDGLEMIPVVADEEEDE